MKTFQTHAGKEIQLVRCHNSPHIRIQFGSGGELPSDLSGIFTDERNAEITINNYLEKTKNRKKDV